MRNIKEFPVTKEEVANALDEASEHYDGRIGSIQPMIYWDIRARLISNDAFFNEFFKDTFGYQKYDVPPNETPQEYARAKAAIEVLDEVMQWIHHWSPAFVEDNDWTETKAKVDAILKPTSKAA